MYIESGYQIQNVDKLTLLQVYFIKTTTHRKFGRKRIKIT